MSSDLDKHNLQKTSSRKNPLPSTGAQNKTNNEQNLFVPTARLNRGQRKYCHCLMQVRTLKKVPYGICRNMSYQTMIRNPGQPGLRFNPKYTNCIMNYDYSKYSLNDIKALAKERGIPIINNKTGRPNNKNTLVQLLTKRYIKNHVKRRQPLTGT